MPTERSRYFVFTNWNVDFDYNRAMGRLQYVRYGEETCPDTGRPHHQGWCYTKEKYSIRQVALALRDLNDERIAWVKIMRASEAANDNYTGKDGIVHEKGRRPNPGARTDLATAYSLVQQGRNVREVVFNAPHLAQYRRQLEYIQDISQYLQSRNFQTTCDWIWGPTGVGKSRYVMEQIQDKSYYRYTERWWDT